MSEVIMYKKDIKYDWMFSWGSAKTYTSLLRQLIVYEDLAEIKLRGGAPGVTGPSAYSYNFAGCSGATGPGGGYNR